MPSLWPFDILILFESLDDKSKYLFHFIHTILVPFVCKKSHSAPFVIVYIRLFCLHFDELFLIWEII